MDANPCPKCSASWPVPVSFTWWGGWLGPKMFNVVKCVACDTQYNAKTGRLNTTSIIVYSVVGGSIAVAFVIARLFI